MNCPKCSEEMELAFCSTSSGLSYVQPQQFEKFAFVDQDLSEEGLLKFLPIQKGKWHPSTICKPCEVYIIEYGKKLTRNEIEEFLTQNA